MSDIVRYKRSQIALHWVVALLIAVNYFLGSAMEEAFTLLVRGQTTEVSAGANAHRMVGVAVLLLVAARLVLRRRNGVPPDPATSPDWMKKAAKLGHSALYVLMFVVPISGMVAFTGLNPGVAAIHGVLVNLLILLALGHASVALYHHYFMKDGLLKRMM